MSLWTRIVSRLVGKATPEEWFREFGSAGSATASGVRVNQFTAMQATTVMACVSLLAEDVAKLPARVKRRLPGGGTEIAKNHPFDKLLRKPNAWQTRFEWVEMLQAALVLRGNAYSAIIRNGRGAAVSLVPINPDWVSLYETTTGAVFYAVTRSTPHEMATLSTLPFLIPAEDMFHLRWLASSNSLLGLSRVSLMREAIGLALSQEQHAARLAGNGARPGGVLSTDGKLSENVAKRLATDWQQNYGGVDNVGRTAVLEQGLKWTPLGMTSVDAEFMASRQYQTEEIARMFRVPLHKIGIIPRGSATTMVQQDQDYLNNVITSYLERWEPKLEELGGLDGDEYYVEFDVSRFLRADIKTRYDAYRTGIVGSFLTPNEVRAAEGLPPADGGDKVLQPTNLAPLGFEPAAASPGGLGSDTTGAPGAGGDGDPTAVVDDSAPAG